MLAERLQPTLVRAALIRAGRHATASRLATRLGLPPPETGCIALRLEHPQRDVLLARFAAATIHIPVHWRDGDWSGDADAAALAAQTFSLPCPPLTADKAEWYVETVACILGRAS